MRVRLIVVYVPRYRRGHRWNFVPPVTGVHLAALTPGHHEVDLVHEQVRPVPIDDWPDVVALSFFSGFAHHAYALADAYRRRGVKVVAGGPHVSYWVEEALAHVDAVIIGEAESVWADVLSDVERGRLRRVYEGVPHPLDGLPTPRYDLLEDRFVVPRVLQATRGCPFACRFCSVPDINPGFRTRPVADVVRDIATSHFRLPWQERVVWFWDDNLLVDRRWAKALLREMAGLGKWWLTQASIDIARDRELLDLMERSGCAGIFFGIESLDREALRSVDKRQNRVAEYRDAVARLHDRGICVMAGLISGFDTQSAEDIVATAEQIDALGFDVPFLSVLTPFRGTGLYDDLLAQGRILRDRGWAHYNGYNVAFEPGRLSPHILLEAHRELWRRAFSPAQVARRLARAAHQLGPGGLMLSAAMNGFYGFKRVTGNIPADAPAAEPDEPGIVHPAATATPVRLHRVGRAARVA